MAKEKFDIYEMVTNRIIAELEKGIIPWKKPWRMVGVSTECAFNRVTKRPYTLLNQMLLSKVGEYASLKQWNKLGGKIKKGAKSEVVVFWKMLPIKEKQKDDTYKDKVIPMLRYYNVFHIDDVEGVEPLGKIDLSNETEKIVDADAVAENYLEKYSIKHDFTKITDRAFYRQADDYVEVPNIKQFKKASEYYSTMFHELTHSTGHKDRLDRLDSNARFGNELYSKEELVAEIGSATILNYLGIDTQDTFQNNVAYIQSWLRVLRNDKRFIVSASSRAEKAVKMILNLDADAETVTV